MAPGPSHRPQTLKQAKKAYRKSGATTRLSESELAMIERRAVLQERADRIREREARRKANLKKKEERIEREREARQRMNLPSPTKGGFHVGPSQLHLGDFMVMGGKRKREEAPSVCGKVGNTELMDTELKSYQALIALPPSRTPLQEASANIMTKVEPHTKTEDSEQPDQDTECPQSVPAKLLPPTQSHNSPPVSSTKPTALPIPSTKSEASKADGEGSKAIKPEEASSMGPPPLPNPSKSKSALPTTQQARSLLAPQSDPPIIPPDPWDDIFVSNTQIVREISLPAIPQAPKPATPTNTPLRPSLPPENETTPSLLSHLTTQDLDTSDFILNQCFLHSPPTPPKTAPPTPPTAFVPNTTTTTTTTTISSLLLQISTQDLEFSSSPSPSFPSPLTPSKPQSQRKSSSEYNLNEDDVTEEDLEDLVLEYEMGSSWHPMGAEADADAIAEGEREGERGGDTDRERERDGEKIYANKEDVDETFESELSTQDWREVGCCV